MKRFAILFFAAVCMVAFMSAESSAQCVRGGGFYGGYGGGVNVYRGGGGYYRSNVYRPSYGFSYGYARPVYRNYGYSYGRPFYGGSYYRGGYGCGGRGISIRF